jgi:cell division protease FtsH
MTAYHEGGHAIVGLSVPEHDPVTRSRSFRAAARSASRCSCRKGIATARNMVTRWGLSDRLGPQTYSEESGEVFLGRSVTQHKQVSDVTAHVIDEEVRHVIDSNYQRAYNIIKTNMDKLGERCRRRSSSTRRSTRNRSRTSWRARLPRPPRDWDDTPTPTPRGPSAEKPTTPLVSPAGQH